MTSFVLDKDRIGKIKAFSHALDAVVKEELSFDGGKFKVQLKGYYGKHDYEYSLGYVGRYFSVTGLFGRAETVWGWLGSYFTAEDGTQGLTLEFDNVDGWGAPVFRNLKSNKLTINYSVPLGLVADAAAMKEQIRSSLGTMLLECKNKRLPKSNKFTSPDELQDVKRIQLFIDQNVFVNRGDIPIEFSTDKVPNDDFSATRWIGRYSHVCVDGWRKLVWLGVFYDERKLTHLESGDKIKADGAQLVLEIGDSRYVVSEERTWDALDIRKSIYSILKDVQAHKRLCGHV